MEADSGEATTRIELGPKLFGSIVQILQDTSGKSSHPNVAYGGKSASQKVNIVGESFYQDALSRFKVGDSYGFFVPDQNNPYDNNAVALYLIDDELMIHKVGHLPKEVAARVSQQIANLLGSNNQIIPVQARVAGGTREKPILGVFAYARTSAVIFN
jgi:hypothetical protein